MIVGRLTPDWAEQRLVLEVRAADAAAQAARAVPGVIRLQPGVFGLLGQLAARAWERVTGRALPDIGGAHAELDGDGALELDLQLVVDGGYQAAAVAACVQLAVPAAVTAALGLTVASVTVHVVDIDLTAD